MAGCRHLHAGWLPPLGPHLDAGGRRNASGAGDPGAPSLPQARRHCRARCADPPLLRRPRLCSIRVDMRGNGDSEGLMEDEYTEQELRRRLRGDRLARRQPWCTGKVGMMGISWGGFNACRSRPSSRRRSKAVDHALLDRRPLCRRHPLQGRAVAQRESRAGRATMLSYSSRPPDPLVVGAERWRELWLRAAGERAVPAGGLAPASAPRRLLEARLGLRGFFGVSGCDLAVGGWARRLQECRSRIGRRHHRPAKGIIGPWVHKYPHFAVPQPAIGFLQEALRWWDHWLKDIDTGVEAEPRLRVYVMDCVRPRRWYEDRPGRWIGRAGWPSEPDARRHLATGRRHRPQAEISAAG